MKYLLITLSLLTATTALAEDKAPNGVEWESYHTNDHFQWTNYDDLVHITIGFGMAYVGADLLNKKAGLPPWEAALIGTLGSIVFESTREAFFSTYTSKTDIKTWSGGAALGGALFYTIHF